MTCFHVLPKGQAKGKSTANIDKEQLTVGFSVGKELKK